MARQQAIDSVAISPQRATRFYRLISWLAQGHQTRDAITKKLKVDERSFYRDLERLRSLGINVTAEDNKYTLEGTLEIALTKLPFPDPGLSMNDALTLAKGTSAAHKRFREYLNTILGQKPTPQNGKHRS